MGQSGLSKDKFCSREARLVAIMHCVLRGQIDEQHHKNEGALACVHAIPSVRQSSRSEG